MTKIVVILIFSFLTYAQIDTTRKDYLPLSIGNIWQYIDSDHQINTMKVEREIILDGVKYFELSGGGPKTLSNYMRMDSLLRIQNKHSLSIFGDTCGGNTPYEESILRLGEKDSAIWKVCDGFNGLLTYSPMVRFNGIGSLGNMYFDFGGPLWDTGDTLWTFGSKLEKGIGIVYERYFEGEYFVLTGAIINGVQYGHIVPVDEENNPDYVIMIHNYPNPFNPSTKIEYQLPERTNVVLKIYNSLAQEISTLIDEEKDAGSYETHFNGAGLSSGIYFAVLQAGEKRKVCRMLLLK